MICNISVLFIIQLILFLFISIHSFHFNPSSSLYRRRNNVYSRLYSTIIAPPKAPLAPTKTPTPSKTPPIPQSDILFKESIDIQKEFDESGFDDKYLVVLFNDPYNKRQYVSMVLMEVFSWTEMMAGEVMLQAHTHGYAVTGEWVKETATEYCDKLLDRGLVAEVIKMGDGADDIDEFDNHENSFQ
jgi:ATP-dependent Clp protease adapter protein ClpS